MLCAQVHRLPDDLGAGSAGWWNTFPLKDWWVVTRPLHTRIIFSFNIYIPKGPQLFSHAESANCGTVKQDRDPKDSWQAVILFSVTWFHLKRSCVSHEDQADCTLCYHVGFKERRFKGGRGCSSLWRSHFLTSVTQASPFPRTSCPWPRPSWSVCSGCMLTSTTNTLTRWCSCRRRPTSTLPSSTSFSSFRWGRCGI